MRKQNRKTPPPKHTRLQQGAYRIRDSKHIETHALPFRLRSRRRADITPPKRRALHPQHIRVVRHHKTHPVPRHHVRERQIIRGRIVGGVARDEGVGRAVQLRARGEGQLEDGGGVGEVVRHRRGHVVGRAVDDEVAEPGLALEEGGVVGVARVQLVESAEEGGEGGGEEVLRLLGVW